jgi:hypothetical protein
VASLLGQSSIAADTLLPSRLATGQIGSNERMRIYEIDHQAQNTKLMIGAGNEQQQMTA